MTRLYKEQPVPYSFISLAVLAAALFFVCRIIYAGVIALPYPKELLEPSNIVLTNTFIEGKSPYTIESLKWDVPGVNYDYPFLNSLLAAGISVVTGCGAIKAHFVISLVSIILSGVIGFAVTKDIAKTTVLPVLTALLFMFCHWRFGYISAAPDDLGLLLFLVTSYLAVSPKIKNKPVWCAAGIMLCFYTKQYFVFIAPGLFGYMLLYSKKDAIKLLLWTLAMNTVIGVLITVFWPLYWIKSFLLTYLGTAAGSTLSFAAFWEQFRYLVVLFVALFMIIVVSAAAGLRKYYRDKVKNRNKMRLDIKENDVLSYSVIQCIIMIMVLLVIGRNDGAFISYFLQLWMPFVSIVALISFERMRPEKHEFIFAGIYAALTLITVYFGFTKLPLHILTDTEIDNWERAYSYTAQYSEKGEVYYSRVLAYDPYMVSQADCVCGHDSEVGDYTVRLLGEAGIKVDSSGLVQEIVEQNLGYRNRILRKAENHTYDLITIDKSGALSLFDEEDCKNMGYECIDCIQLQLGNMPYEVLLYADFTL